LLANNNSCETLKGVGQKLVGVKRCKKTIKNIFKKFHSHKIAQRSQEKRRFNTCKILISKSNNLKVKVFIGLLSLFKQKVIKNAIHLTKLAEMFVILRNK